MTKANFIKSLKPVAYYSGIGGIEIYYIEYGANDYIYYVTGAWCGCKTYHKSKIYYTQSGCYFNVHGYRIPLNECIRMGV